MPYTDTDVVELVKAAWAMLDTEADWSSLCSDLRAALGPFEPEEPSGDEPIDVRPGDVDGDKG